MRVVAARFPDPNRASAALSALRRHLPLSPRDAAIAPLGIPGASCDTDTLLAGHFHESDTLLVANVVRQQGGEIVADVDESWTLPRGWMREADRQQAGPATSARRDARPSGQCRAGGAGERQVSTSSVRADRGRSRQPVAY